MLNAKAQALVDKYALIFIPANYDKIDDSTLLGFANDVATTFGEAAPNIAVYKASTSYLVGDTVRYTPSGGKEAFYYALRDGLLTAPQTGGSSDWKVVPGPVEPTALSQTLTLFQAQGLDRNGVIAGRDYLIEIGTNAQGQMLTIAVRGVSNDFFDVEGTLEVNGVRTAITDFNVQAGTWKVKQYGGGGTTSTHSTTQGLRATGPILFFARPGALVRQLIDNVDDNVYQVNYRDTANQKWIVGLYLGTLAAANAALAAVPSYAFDFGVQLRIITVPLDNTVESNFVLIGAGGNFYSGNSRPFLTQQTGPPLGNVLLNSQFTQPMGSGWNAGNGSLNVTMGNGTATFINSTSYADCLQNINLQARDYELRVGITRLANNSLLKTEVFGNGLSVQNLIGGLGTHVIPITITVIGSYTVSLCGITDGDLNYCYLVPV